MAADYFDYGLDGTPSVDTTDWADVAALLDESQEQREARLEQELAAIERQLAERTRIHQEIVADLAWQIDRYTDRLNHLYSSGTGRADGERQELKDRIAAFAQDLRDEYRAHWRDRQDLERERRTIQRELAEITDTTLSDLL